MKIKKNITISIRAYYNIRNNPHKPGKQKKRQGGYGTLRMALPRAGLLSLKGYALTPKSPAQSLLQIKLHNLFL
jgi:hypothetical protein